MSHWTFVSDSSDITQKYITCIEIYNKYCTTDAYPIHGNIIIHIVACSCFKSHLFISHRDIPLLLQYIRSITHEVYISSMGISYERFQLFQVCLRLVDVQAGVVRAGLMFLIGLVSAMSGRWHQSFDQQIT